VPFKICKALALELGNEEAVQLENDGKENSGYTYLSPDNEPMLEFHVHDGTEFYEQLNNLPFSHQMMSL
jgi:hypothetical protein